MAEPPQLLVELEDNPDTHEYPLCLDRPSTLKECIAEVLQEFSIEEDPRSYTLLVKRGDAYVRLSNAQYLRLPVDKDPRFRLHRDKHHASSPRTPSSTAGLQAYTNGSRASQVPPLAFTPTASTSVRIEEEEPQRDSPAPQHEHHKSAQSFHYESVGQEGQVSPADKRQEPKPQPATASDAAPSRTLPEHSPSVELTVPPRYYASLGMRASGASLQTEIFGMPHQAEVKPEPASPAREVLPTPASSQSTPASRQSSQAQPPVSAGVSSWPAAANGLSQSKRVATPPSAEQPPQKRIKATAVPVTDRQQTPQTQVQAPRPRPRPRPPRPSPARQQPMNAAAAAPGSLLQVHQALPSQDGQAPTIAPQMTTPAAAQSSQATAPSGTKSQSSPNVETAQHSKTVVKNAQGQIFAVDNFKLDPLPHYAIQLVDSLPEKLRLQAWMELCFQRQKNKRMVQRDAWHAFRTHSMRPESPRFPRLTAPNYIGELKNHFTETSIYKVAKVDGSGEVFLIEHLTPRRPFPSPDDAAALISKVSNTPANT